MDVPDPFRDGEDRRQEASSHLNFNVLDTHEVRCVNSLLLEADLQHLLEVLP